MIKLVDEAIEEQKDNYYYMGIRFENKERFENEIIKDNSKSNVDRETERDFPEYGTEEYDTMDDVEGVSAYDLSVSNRTSWTPGDTSNVNNWYLQQHCYIVGSECANYGEDNDEIIMKNAKVLSVIF